MELVDKYYCTHCQEYIFASSLELLATRLNNHNKVKHPLDFSDWTAETVAVSAMYSGPGGSTAADIRAAAERNWKSAFVSRPEALGSNEWGNAKHPPDITELDKVFLKGGLVLWDSK